MIYVYGSNVTDFFGELSVNSHTRVCVCKSSVKNDFLII